MLLWGRRNIFKGNGRMLLWEKVENIIARTEGKGDSRKWEGCCWKRGEGCC